MQAWSRLTGLRPVVERMRPTLRTYRDERGRELFDLEDGVIADADLPVGVRFLPDYDNALLSHDDRSRIIQPLPWPELGDNVTAPVYLVDGNVAGIWKLEKAPRRAEPSRLVIRPLVDHSADDDDAITAGPRRLQRSSRRRIPRPRSPSSGGSARADAAVRGSGSSLSSRTSPRAPHRSRPAAGRSAARWWADGRGTP